MVKVDANTISYNYNETINVPNDTTQASWGEKSYKIFTNNYWASTSINYSFAVSHPYSSTNFNATLYINSTQLYSWNYRNIANTYAWTLNLDNQADLIIKTVFTNSGAIYCEYINIVLNTSGTAIINKAYNKKAIPKDVKEIWEKETAYLFGMLPNWEWRDGN